MSETREVKLPEDLCQRVEQIYKQRFGNLEQFLPFVLETLVQSGAAHADEAEREIIEQRLKDLGYI